MPVALFTWNFDYTWKIANLAPWQLACGGRETWHAAHLALLRHHHPDLIFYEGAGAGSAEPQLLEEDDRRWVVLDRNTGARWAVDKISLALSDAASGRKGCDPVGRIESPADADRLVPPFTGWPAEYLAGLRRLIEAVGDEALVLPHWSPPYICACYALGFERAMELMLADPPLMDHVIARLAAGDELRMSQLAAAGAEAVFIADGWASCDIVSPEFFDRFALPAQQGIVKAARRAGLRVILWNEGDVRPLLAREAALPIDAFAWEQPRKGSSLAVAEARAAFGPGRCLLGNLDSEALLLRNDAAEIAAAVREQIAQSRRGPAGPCPFILCTGSPIPSNCPPEAVDAMLQAAR